MTQHTTAQESHKVANSVKAQLETMANQIEDIANAMPERGHTCNDNNRHRLLKAYFDLQELAGMLELDDFRAGPQAAPGWSPEKLQTVLKAFDQKIKNSLRDFDPG